MKEPTKPLHRSRLKRGLYWLAVTGLLCAVTTLLLLQLLLTSPFATRQASTFLGQTLQRSVQLDGLRLTFTGLELRGLRIANTPGLAEPWLLQVVQATIVPDWRQLLQGSRVVTRVRIGSPRLHLARTGRDSWNLLELLRPLTGKKRPGPELVIGRLTISDGTILFPGGSLQVLELDTTDLATQGSRPLTFTLKTQGPHGVALSATGTARLGPQPTADVTLNASAPLAPLARKAARLLLNQGVATGTAKLTLAAGQLTYEATGTIAGASWRTTGEARPFPLMLHLEGNYDLNHDLLRLAAARLDLAEPVTVLATGSLAGVKKERRFAVDLSASPLDLAPLLQFLPRPASLQLQGQLRTAQLRLAGDRHGLKEATGRITLQDLGVSRSGTALMAGTAADARLTLDRNGWQLAGNFTQPQQQAPLIQALDLPFRCDFSRTFALRTAQGQPRLTLHGTPVSGEFSYQAAAPAPLRGQFRVPPLPLAALAPLGQGLGIVPSTGTVSADFRFQGTPANLTGQLSLQGHGLAARLKETPVALTKLATALTVTQQRGTQPTLSGTVRGEGGKWRKTPFDLAARLTYGDQQLQLRNVTATLGGTHLTAAAIDYPLLPPVMSGGRRLQPLHGTASGVSIGGATGPYLRDADITSRLELQQEGPRRWLAGTAQLKVRDWQLRQVRQGAAQAVVECHESGATLQLQGAVLGGQLTGTAQFQPLAISKGVDFSAQATTVDPTRLEQLLPGQRPRFTGGTLAATARGNYQPKSGFSGNFTLTGSELALTLPNGKTLLTGANGRLTGELNPDRLVLPAMSITLAPALQLAASGELQQPFSKERRGILTLSPGSAPLSTWLDTFANVLPRPLQEAVAAGQVSLAGALRLAPGQTLIDGSIGFQGGALEIPGQKLYVTGVTGTIPLSLVTGAAKAPPPAKPRHERRDYPTLLADLRRPGQTGTPLRIETIAFGPLRIGPTTMNSRASDGLLEITRLESTLFNGQLHGRGSLRLGNRLRYEADLLLNDLSLRLLCDAFPAIKGYLSGRVDGMLGLLGDGPGVDNLVGSVELWTRSTPAEEMLISKEFLQKLAGKKLKGYFFRDDRPFDRGEIVALLQSGYLTFDTLDISHSILGFRDLSVSVAAVQNRIAIDHLLGAIKAATARGKAVTGSPEEAPPIETEFKWAE